MIKKFIRNLSITTVVFGSFFAFQGTTFAEELSYNSNKPICADDAFYNADNPRLHKIPTSLSFVSGSSSKTTLKSTTSTMAIETESSESSDSTTNLQGKVKGLTILINFPSSEPTSETHVNEVHNGDVAPDKINNFFNQVGYSGDENNGSIRDYYYDVSGGKLEYTNNVMKFYYTAKHIRSYYDNENSPCAPTADCKAIELIKEALSYLASNHEYDEYFQGLTLDQNGKVMGLNVLYAGDPNNFSEMCGLWPHQGYLFNQDSNGEQTDGVEYNGVKFKDYALSNIGTTLYLGVVAHETGHMICGWPDTYSSRSGGGSGTGNYDLMSEGWEDSTRKNPVWPDPFCRCVISGWGNVTKLNDISGPASITASASKHDAFIYKTDNPYEYYMIENVSKTGRGANMPDDGLMIWHIDTSVSGLNDVVPFETRTSAIPTNHYGISIVQADGLYQLEKGQNKGLVGDLFKADGVDKFTATTSVNSNLYDGTMSKLYITNISNAGENMTFTYAKATDTELPTVPQNLGLNNRSGLVIQLDWNSSTDNVGIDHYCIYEDVNDGNIVSRKKLGDTDGNCRYYTIHMEINKIYSFYVAAVDTQGNESELSSPYVFSTDTIAPTQPTGVSISDLKSDGGFLRWTESNNKLGDTKYRIYNGDKLVGETDGTTFNLTGLTPNTEYSFTVEAYDRNYDRQNVSAPSDVLKFKTLASPPSNFTIANRSGMIAKLSWNPSTNAVKYHLSAFVNGQSIYKTMDWYTSDPFYILNLGAEATYRFKVKAVDALGTESEESKEILISTDTTAPTAPTDLQYFKLTSNSVELNWKDSDDTCGVKGYRVYDGTTLIAEASDSAVNINNLTKGNHKITVKAYNYNNMESPASNEISFSNVILPPTNFEMIAGSGLTRVFSWDNMGAAKYIIYGDTYDSRDGNNVTATGIKLGEVTSGTTMGVDFNPGIYYSVYIVAVATDGSISEPTYLIGSNGLKAIFSI